MTRHSRCAIWAVPDERNPGRRRWKARCFVCAPMWTTKLKDIEDAVYEGAKWIHARMWFINHLRWHAIRPRVLTMALDENEAQQFRNTT